MRRKFLLAILVLSIFVFTISAVSAEIMLSQPQDLYNIGDTLSISTTLTVVTDTDDFLKLSLKCGNLNETEFYSSRLMIPAGEEEIIEKEIVLTKNFLQNATGNCKIIARYADQIERTSPFIISSRIAVTAHLSSYNYNPSETVIIKGEAIKDNSIFLDGFYEIFFEGINSTSKGVIREGSFEHNLTLSENIIAGIYLIKIKAYEKEGEKITNLGETELTLNIKQLPSKVDVAIDSQNIYPGNNLDFKILLYDQGENIIDGEASFIIEDKNQASFAKKLTKINEPESFFVKKNLTSGYYKIKAYSAGLYGERQFFVEENEEAEFQLINDTLTITNLGNVPYRKPVQIVIGEEVEVKELNLDIGEKIRFALSAPDGNYPIKISDGTITFSETVPLTGSSIGVSHIKDKAGIFSRYFLAWFFIIGILGMLVFVMAKRTFKRKSYAYPVAESDNKGILKIIPRKIKSIAKPKISEKPGTIMEAEHNLVLKGVKQNAGIICIKFKNNEDMLDIEKNLLLALRRIEGTKAAVYQTGNCFFFIFSPLLTRTFKNHTNATKTALSMSRSLFNKTEFGISVHAGDIVNKVEGNRLKFTSLGNSLNLAKRIAELSKGEVLLSKELHEKTLSDIKTEKTELAGLPVFKIRRITDTQKNKKFVQDFLKKLEQEKK